MSLMKTLAKLAIGYAAARGVDRMSGGGGLGALLGGGAQVRGSDPIAAQQAQMGRMMTGEAPSGSENPMAGMMDMLQKSGLGGMMTQAGTANPMAGLMDRLQSSSPDLGAMMGSTAAPGGGLLSQLGTGGAGLAGMFAALGGAAASAQGQSTAALLNTLQTQDTAPQVEEAAGLMLRAMVMAAKADGGIDASEQAKIIETLGDDTDAESRAFVEAQLEAPVDAQALAAEVPEAQRMQVYAASLMTIRVDTQAEAEYLDSLARAMHLQEPVVNALHMQMGLQPLYA